MDANVAKPPRSLRGLEGVLVKMFTKAATVSELEQLTARYRLITLSGPKLAGVRWVPGMKVQMALGGFVSRTYTPIEWDGGRGLTRLVAYVHGDTPASAWVKGLEVGVSAPIFGPSDSLDLAALGRPGLLFGDETSIGLAHALRFSAPGSEGVSIVLEVSSRAETEAVLARMQIHGVSLIERRPDDAHVGELEALVAQQVKARAIASAVLSGKATSIQRLNRQLRALGLTSRQLKTKAYWAPGKTGLD
jgi:ferric-chelate reductase (NADPH)